MNSVRISELIAPAFMPVHRDLKQGGHREYWLNGGRGSMKSSFISIELILFLLRRPDAHAIVYRKVAATLRESVYGQIVWAIDRLGLHDWFRFRLSPLEIEYRPTGQRILFRGADDPGKSKSIKLAKGYFGFLWFEELDEFGGMQDVRTIKASVLRGGDGTVTFCSYNPPKSARNWVNEEVLVPRSDRLTHHSTYLDAPRAWLGEDFIAEAEALRAANEPAWRHMYLGEVTGTGGNVFDNLTLRPIPDHEIRTFGSTFAGLDWGWFPDPACFIRCAYFPALRELLIYDEFTAVRTSNQELHRRLVTDKGLTNGEEVIADSAEEKSINDMRSYGMRCIGAMKGPGSVAAGMKWLQSLRRIVIDPARCPTAAKEFFGYEYERTRDGGFTSTYPDRDNHTIDAVRYATNRIWLKKGA